MTSPETVQMQFYLTSNINKDSDVLKLLTHWLMIMSNVCYNKPNSGLTFFLESEALFMSLKVSYVYVRYDASIIITRPLSKTLN